LPIIVIVIVVVREHTSSFIGVLFRYPTFAMRTRQGQGRSTGVLRFAGCVGGVLLGLLLLLL